MSELELLGRLNGYLFVVSSQIGKHPQDNIYYCSLYELEDDQLLESYRKNCLDPKINTTLQKSDTEELSSEDEIYSFSNLAKESDGTSWLEGVFRKNLIEKIKSDEYLIWHIMEQILIIRDDYSIPHIFHCTISNNNYKGLLVFIPCIDKKYLVMTLLSKK